ncbi:hypothetical protein [Paenibacillus sp. FSL H8-0034]|uniref:hypothetical protein n=1 Tax=Paenibacillus sp. FSL H8-0034 TaxID=2954671 RepID=UPI0030F776A8
MTYVPKTNWQYDDLVTETDMNRIEKRLAETAVVILSSVEPANPDTHTFWLEDVGEDYDPGGGGVVIENAALDGSEPIWLDEE